MSTRRSEKIKPPGLIESENGVGYVDTSGKRPDRWKAMSSAFPAGRGIWGRGAAELRSCNCTALLATFDPGVRVVECALCVWCCVAMRVGVSKRQREMGERMVGYPCNSVFVSQGFI